MHDVAGTVQLVRFKDGQFGLRVPMMDEPFEGSGYRFLKKTFATDYDPWALHPSPATHMGREECLSAYRDWIASSGWNDIGEKEKSLLAEKP